jgi:GAF domain-containing protein
MECYLEGMVGAYLSKLVRIACELADAKGATLYLVDGPALRPYIIYNLPKEYIDGIGVVRVGEQCCGRAVEKKRPWIVADMLIDPLFVEGRQGAVDSPIRAGFSVPVLDRNEVIASLACHFEVPHTPSQLDIERNQVFANLIAITLRGIDLSTVMAPVFVPSFESTLSAASD